MGKRATIKKGNPVLAKNPNERESLRLAFPRERLEAESGTGRVGNK